MPKIRQKIVSVFSILMLVTASGCMMPVGYSYVKDTNTLANVIVDVVKVEQKKIYDTTEVFLVGPLAGSKATGVKYSVTDMTGKVTQVLQPKTDKYTLKVGEKARLIAVRGQVWVQPLDYPLPPEFGLVNSSVRPPALTMPHNEIVKETGSADVVKQAYKPNLTAGWVEQDMPDNVKAGGASLYALNGAINGGLLYFPHSRADISDFKIFVEARQLMQATALKNAAKSEIRFFDMSGHQAASFEVTGDTNGMRYTYFRTIVENNAEVRDLNMWSLVSNFKAAKPHFEVLASQLGQ